MTGGPVATGGVTPQGPDFVALMNTILAANTTSANNTSATTSASTKTQEKQHEPKQISRGELLTLLQMCGKSSIDKLSDLFVWLQLCASKVTTEPYIMMIVLKYIMENTFFEFLDVLMSSQLLKINMNRSCSGKDGNINRPSLVHAMGGLSPFNMLHLNEDDVALLNDE